MGWKDREESKEGRGLRTRREEEESRGGVGELGRGFK